MADESETTTSIEHAEPSQSERGRSTISFPYLHLELCLQVVQAVYELGGDECEWNQLAVHMGHAPDGGGFRQRLTSARIFGLLDYANQRVTLTEVGRRCVDELTARGSRVDAFLKVPLFHAMFGKLDGQKLPPSDAVESQMTELGVAPKQARKARHSFMRSAQVAGFFEISPDRMSKPRVGQRSAKAEDPDEDQSNSRTSDPGNARHALIEALLDQMPAPGGEWEAARCLIWVQTLVSSLSIVYTNLEELQAIEVRMRSDRNAS